MRCLIKRKVDVTLTFLGNGREIENVKNKVAEYGLDGSISFKGNVFNVEDYLKEANLYVHSAKYEPFGLVLLEAMASGLPVVALDGKGNRDIVINSLNGFLIEEENVELFADKIMELIYNENTYRQMSENALEFSKRFDIANYIERLLELYKGI